MTMFLVILAQYLVINRLNPRLGHNLSQVAKGLHNDVCAAFIKSLIALDSCCTLIKKK